MVEDKGTTPPVGTSTPILGVFEGSSQNYAKDVIIFRLRWTIKESALLWTMELFKKNPRTIKTIKTSGRGAFR